MWEDDAACNFLGGTKIEQERVKCKSGEEHKWKRIVKCVQGDEVLSSGGFDYKTGGLSKDLYNFQECKLYSAKDTNEFFWYLLGKKYDISHAVGAKLFKNGVKITTVTAAQASSVQFGSPGFTTADHLARSQGGALFVTNSANILQIENQAAFDNCNFDMAKVTDMSDKEYAKFHPSDYIVAP